MRLRPPAVLLALLLAAPVAVVGQQPPATGDAVPGLLLTAPTHQQVLWEDDLVLAADATPADGRAIARVDFYLDAHDTGAKPVPFRSDDSAPYTVRVPLDDLGWELLSTHKITAVAVDTAGRASAHPASAGAGGTSWVTVGPPPVVDWVAAPPAPPTVAGSTSAGLRVDFSAAVDGRVPDHPEHPPAALRRIEHLLDGKVVHTVRPEGEPRTLAGSAFFSPDRGLTGGVHRVGVRVTVAYHRTLLTRETVEADVLVADGTRLAGPVRAGRRTVEDGFVVTAGDVVRFRAPVAAKVPGTFLRRAHLFVDDSDSQGWTLSYRDFPCEQPASCPDRTTIRSQNRWYVPEGPGQATLTLTASVFGDQRGTVARREIVIQAAARLTADVSRHRVRRGKPVRVTGRLTSLHDRAAQADQTVLSSGGARAPTAGGR